MKKIFCLIMVFVALFALASCSKKKSHDYEEQVSKEIKADEGGKVESSDGKTSVDIPAGALDEDTKITMTIYDASEYSDENGKIVSKVVDFEPTGTIFKKPVIIKMATEEVVEKKTISAAVYDEKEEKWSYSRGVFAIIKDGKTDAGDPIMTSAAGDPIMLNAAGDPIMQSTGEMLAAAGDPIMLVMENAAGDPIMTSAAGDPIMINAAGDPIMKAGAGDPIMMTTGHFTAYTFIVTDPREGEPERPDEESVDDSDDTDISDNEISDEDEEALPDEDTVPEPPKVYSKVPCTGFTFCVNDKDQVIECPINETADFYGQDAQYAIRRSCVPRSFETLYSEENEDEYEMPYPMVYDNVTKLTWLPTDINTEYEDNEHTFCDELEYAGHDDWRFPTPKEIQTLTIKHMTTQWGTVLHPVYFADFSNSFPGYLLAVDEDNHYCYDPGDGDIVSLGETSYCNNVYYMCVRGEEYGKVDENNYEIRGEGNEQVVFDSATNLLWQKGSVSGKTWKEAFSYCENLNYAGYSDWRLPNRNELMSLVDYSKSGTDVMSSFPGMEAEEFIVSTSLLGFPESGYWTFQWTLSMNDGTTNNTFNEDAGSYSVRCVRSDLDAAPADGIPECDEKIGYTPCRDSVNNIVWSMIIMEPENSYDWNGAVAAETCTNATMHGKNKWRLPTVDELRTLMKEDKLKVGGECGVTTASCLDRSCYEETKCSFDEDYVFESKFLDYEMLVSGDIVENDDHVYDTVWVIDPYEDKSGFSELSIYEEDSSSVGYVFSTVVRCVLDESLSGEETPYDDPQTGLSWSDISTNVTYSEAEAYCTSLNEGSDNWRMPSATELQTLVINCEDAPCKMTMDGRYSVLGDTGYLWFANGEANALNFSNADFASLDTDSFYARVRCVRSE